MANSFYEECKRIITDSAIEPPIEESILALWIYLQIYYYTNTQQLSVFTHKEVFLKAIEDDMSFNSYTDIFKNISEELYVKVFSKIVSVFSCYDGRGLQVVPLKDFEILFEGALHNRLRSRTGTYYTPTEIVDLMVDKSILATIKDEALRGTLKDVLDCPTFAVDEARALKLIKHLQQLRVIDIACGGGVFLRQALNTLTNAVVKLYKRVGVEKQHYHIKKELLKNIYGIDVQKNTIALCKLLMLMEVNSQPWEEGSRRLSLNIIEGDGLLTREINNEPLDKSFDIVIGNPPYIGEKGNKRLFDRIKDTAFGQEYYESKMDYFYFFIYRGHQLLKKEGILAYITTNYFVTADGGYKLREFFKDSLSLSWIVNFNEVSLFKEAKGQHNLVFLATKTNSKADVEIINVWDKSIKIREVKEQINNNQGNEGITIARINHSNLFDNRGNILLYHEGLGGRLQERILEASNLTLGEVCNINQGIVSGADRLSVSGGEALKLNENIGKGIFVLREEEIEELGFNQMMYQPFLKEFYKNSDVSRYHTKAGKGLKILYLNDEFPENIEEYPAIYNHLVRYKALLMNRREVKKATRRWYALQWPRRQEIFEGKKILVPQRSTINSFAYHEGPWYASADVYYISAKAQHSLLYILGILNSSLMYFWLFHRGKKKGEYLELYSTPLKSIPICYTEDQTIINEMEALVFKLSFEKLDRLQYQQCYNKVDQLVFQLYGLNNEDIIYIHKFMKDRNINS